MENRKALKISTFRTASETKRFTDEQLKSTLSDLPTEGSWTDHLIRFSDFRWRHTLVDVAHWLESY